MIPFWYRAARLSCFVTFCSPKRTYKRLLGFARQINVTSSITCRSISLCVCVCLCVEPRSERKKTEVEVWLDEVSSDDGEDVEEEVPHHQPVDNQIAGDLSTDRWYIAKLFKYIKVSLIDQGSGSGMKGSDGPRCYSSSGKGQFSFFRARRNFADITVYRETPG
jgi:hypothetical protein